MDQVLATEPAILSDRVEDPALLTGAGRYMDDLPEPLRTAHAAILRSSHAHANIININTTAASKLAGVVAIITGKDVAKVTDPLMVGVKIPIQCWPLAQEKVRYTGEPIAVVLAESRYIAEDALDLIEVLYESLQPVVNPVAALDSAAPHLHRELESNLGHERFFRYGNPDEAFENADRTVSVDVTYPRNSCTPIETFGLIAQFDPNSEAYDILANFQGPFSIHPVIARSLRVPGNRLRLRTPPDSGGSFGVKQGIFPYMVLLAACARVASRPVKWVEDRLEHLTASVSGTNRTIRLKAAVKNDGRITALDWDQIEDVGAYLRAPEPATLYRMHGNLCGAYDIPNLAVRNRVVMTNKTPTGLNRGFGGPQIYFALERLTQRIALELDLDHLEIIQKNLISADDFPHKTASGATYDSGNYQEALKLAFSSNRYQGLMKRRETARAEGKLYGIGLTAAVEPSVSNMGYLSTALTPEQRKRQGPKNGALSSATISIDPVGTISVQLDSVPQGQGHKTVAANVVAQILGIDAANVNVVAELDTAKDAWSIAAGNYSSRFAAAAAGAVKIAADRLRERLARIAATQLNAKPAEIVFSDGKIFPANNPDNSTSFRRIASSAHWAPATLPDGIPSSIRETAIWSAPELTAPTQSDGINSSLCHAFIFDFCGVEIDRSSGAMRIDHYTTTHDCGNILHEKMVEGQIRGAFAQAVGAALYEEYAYDDDGVFLAGTFADYPVPTVHEIPDLEILHISTPSPLTPLGAKGVGEGNCMSTPVCIANAVGDALEPECGWVDIQLPITPSKLIQLLGPEQEPPQNLRPKTVGREASGKGDKNLSGSGEALVDATPQEIWDILMDPDQLASIIPGAHSVRKLSQTSFAADVTIGIGPVKGRYSAEVGLSEMNPPHSVLLSGKTTGALGSGEGVGHVTLTQDGNNRTVVAYQYEAKVGGKVAAVGGRLLDGAAKIIIRQFFTSLGNKAAGKQPGKIRSLINKLSDYVGRRS